MPGLHTGGGEVERAIIITMWRKLLYAGFETFIVIIMLDLRRVFAPAPKVLVAKVLVGCWLGAGWVLVGYQNTSQLQIVRHVSRLCEVRLYTSQLQIVRC